MFRQLIAAGAIAALGSVSVVTAAPAAAAGGVPCRAIPSPWCDPTQQPDDPMKPRDPRQGKTEPRQSGRPG